MGFKLYRNEERPKEALIPVVVPYHAETLLPVEDEAGMEEGTPLVVFFCRPPTTADMDILTSEDGEASERLKVLSEALVVEVEGLEDAQGAPVTKLTSDIIDMMPLWMTTALVQGITKATGLTKGEENFSEPPSVTS